MADSGTILRTPQIDDGAGGSYPGTPQQTTATGMFWALSGDELERAAQLGQVGRYRWALPVDTDILVTDSVLLLGVLYRVVWSPPVAHLDAERIVGLEEAQADASNEYV